MQQEIETIVADSIRLFSQDYLGRRPKQIGTHLFGDILVVRLQGILSSAEQQLANNSLAEKGRDLVKRLSADLIETTRPVLEALVEGSNDGDCVENGTASAGGGFPHQR